MFFFAWRAVSHGLADADNYRQPLATEKESLRMASCALEDHKENMVVISGFNVFPCEREKVISICSGVFECADIDISDDRQGEVIRFVLVKNDPSQSKEDIST